MFDLFSFVSKFDDILPTKIIKSANMAGLYVCSLFACIWQFNEILPNSSHLSKSSNPPTWQASMCLAYMHLFGNLTKSCQIRYRCDCKDFVKFAKFTIACICGDTFFAEDMANSPLTSFSSFLHLRSSFFFSKALHGPFCSSSLPSCFSYTQAFSHQGTRFHTCITTASTISKHLNQFSFFFKRYREMIVLN